MKRYPIAERFTSLQGEGLYTGTLMHFVRFAGCSVGKKVLLPEVDKLLRQDDTFAIYREKCTTYDGREFLCDTDFRTKEVLSMERILADVPKGVKRICLTGGEPMNQPLAEWFEYIGLETDFYLHVETSGTISMEELWPRYRFEDNRAESEREDPGWLWITVSPKLGCLPEMVDIANEIKLLVDENFDIEKVPQEIIDHDMVWIQPINDEWNVSRGNLDRCIKLLHEHPSWRISTQMHKIWRVR